MLEQACDDGATRKTLWRGHDGTRAESVLMGYPDRATVCVSSQAGCGMACPFCATGQGGLQRNLSTGEIVEQVRQAAAAARDGALGAPTRLSNVVFMGMGEPLANYQRVVAAVRRITEPAPDGLGISARGVTVSTVGLVPAIDRLAAEGLPVTLAVSLHTPDDELRDTLVPGQQPLEGRRGARRRPPLRAGHRAPGVDRVRADPRRQRPAVAGRPAREAAAPADRAPSGCTSTSSRSTRPRAASGTPRRGRCRTSSCARVQAAGVACTVRDTRGREIAAACGQLAASEA